MKTYHDVQKLLLRFGIYTYMGDRDAELELSLIELKALKHEGVLTDDEYYQSLRIILHEKATD